MAMLATPPGSSPLWVGRHDARLRRMRRSVLTSARIQAEETAAHGARPRAAMVTLTYRDDAAPGPRDVSGLLAHIRKWMQRRGHKGIRYVWVLELTKRGRPHYHIVLWLPRGLTLPKPDKQGWWPHGSTRIEWARRAVGYLAKYASKGLDEGLVTALPKGARLSGCGGLDPEGRDQRRWWLAPSWVREVAPEWTAKLHPAPGGGWVARVSGQWWASPWSLLVIASGGVWIKRNPEANPS